MSRYSNSDKFRAAVNKILVAGAACGAMFYLIVIASWILLAYAELRDSAIADADLRRFWHAIPAPLLFGMFLTALFKRKKKRFLHLMLVSALLIMLCWSLYDGYQGHYQYWAWIDVRVCSNGAYHYYLNWPWMNEIEPWLPYK